MGIAAEMHCAFHLSIVTSVILLLAYRASHHNPVPAGMRLNFILKRASPLGASSSDIPDRTFRMLYAMAYSATSPLAWAHCYTLCSTFESTIIRYIGGTDVRSRQTTITDHRLPSQVLTPMVAAYMSTSEVPCVSPSWCAP